MIAKQYWEKAIADHEKDDCVLWKYGKPTLRYPVTMIDVKTGEVIHAYWKQEPYERMMAHFAQLAETRRLEESARFFQRAFKINKMRFGGKVKDRGTKGAGPRYFGQQENFD